MKLKNDSEQCQHLEWNESKLILLPLEVLDHIASYLNSKDLKECMCTSISFNMKFRPFQYRSTVIKTRRCFTKFLNILDKYNDAATTTNQKYQEQQEPTTVKRRKTNNIPRFTHVGEHVLSLELQDGFMLSEGMKKLAKLCTNVASLRFQWYNVPDHNMVSITDTTYLFRSPVPLFRHFHPHTLTSLTLEGNQYASDISHSPRRPNTMVFPVLRFIPQLESLRLFVHALTLTIDDLEELHRLCPKLQHFECSLDTDLVKYGFTSGTAVTPAHTMKKLVLPQYRLWDDIAICTSVWWTYICTKYPSIKILILNSPAQQKNITRSQLSGPLLSQEEHVLLYSMELKKDCFPQLEEIHIGPFAGRPSSAWPLLVKDIPNVTLIGDATHGFSDWTHHPSTDRIQQLSLLIIPKAFDQLSQCALLTHLELGCYETFYNRYQKLPMDVLLLACPFMYKLIASNCLICYGDNKEDSDTPKDQESTSTTITTPDSDGNIDKNTMKSTAPSSLLRILIIRDSVLNDDKVLPRIGDRCPQLSHLDLSACIWFTPDSSKHLTTRINMPNRYFSYLRISDPSMFDYIIPEMRPATAQFGWFGSHSHEYHQPRYHVRVMDTKDIYYTAKRMDQVQQEGYDNDDGDDVLTKKKRVTLLHIERDQHEKAIVLLPTMDKSNKRRPYTRKEKLIGHTLWSLAFYCHRVDQLYFNDFQLSVGNQKSCKKAKRNDF
ncbi:hypothetical protein BDA99DRAFT_606550 [Phascolomyces articulosus]|uniref:F-box domain-containing protein n=1 Tax=Phascolomyces articulosus TaxID=60185 RepID=A0AAD5JWG1_9FUNG|nr:hypothetical protein BDA99DRAFT_606550 [Phascolomyces articulosus]